MTARAGGRRLPGGLRPGRARQPRRSDARAALRM